MLEYQRDMYVAFLDLTAAFDNVDRNKVWKVLEERGIPYKLRKVAESVYREVYGRVRINGRISSKFNMEKGLKQGDSLSPLLFNLLMDKVTKECNNKTRNCKTKIGHWHLVPVNIQSLTFADDKALIAETPDKLQQIVRSWEDKTRDMDMIVNPNKSKILHITKNKENRIQNICITLNGEQLENVEQYKYLGTIFTSNGKISEEIKQRIKQATNVYYSINRTIIGKQEVSTKTKLQVYNSIYKPILLYGSESWPMTSRIEQQITAAEMRFLRKVANKTRRDLERNVKIREDLGTTSITTQIESKQLKWYGHVKRMHKDRIPRKVWEARVEGKRSRGRPRATWLQNIERAGKKRNKNLVEMNGLLTDRKKWKHFTEIDPTP